MTLSIEITPEVAEYLVDDPLNIVVYGLNSGQRVTVAASTIEDGFKFTSCGHYRAGTDGVVDLTKMESSGGTYIGTEPMGLFWSLVPARNQKKGLRLLKRDASKPMIFHINVVDGHWSNDDESAVYQQLKLVDTVINRFYQSRHVTAFAVRSGQLRGKLFLPPGDGTFPGVVDMFGTGGGLIEFRAALIASRGFAVLALAYFGYEDQPNAIELNLEYFTEAVDWLYKVPCVLKTGIGIVGTSKGGQLALQTAALSDKVVAVVAINPLCFNAMGVHYLAGQPHPVVNGEIEDLYETEEGLVYKKSYAYRERHRNSVLPIEKSLRAHFLFLVSEDDETCDETHVNTLLDRMRKSESRDAISRCTVLKYPGAGHLLEPPYSPLCRACHTKIVGTTILYGGSTKPHAVAQVDSWRRMLTFLRDKMLNSYTQESEKHATLSAVTRSQRHEGFQLNSRL